MRLHFEVRDKDVATRKRPAYLLAISWHNGALRFEALHAAGTTAPEGDIAFSGGDLAREIETIVRNQAASWGIALNKLGGAAALL